MKDNFFEPIDNASLIKKGVKLINANTISIGKNVQIDKNVVIYPNVTIFDNVTIKANTIIQPSTTIFNNVIIHQNCLIGSNTIIREDVNIGKNSIVGPHCEIVRSKIGANCVIAHKNYIGDAIIFDEVKFGCGAIIANTDFKQRFQTIIHEKAKIGINASLIAPLTIGKNALVAAGSVINKNINDNELAIARCQQINKHYKK